MPLSSLSDLRHILKFFIHRSSSYNSTSPLTHKIHVYLLRKNIRKFGRGESLPHSFRISGASSFSFWPPECRAASKHLRQTLGASPNDDGQNTCKATTRGPTQQEGLMVPEPTPLTARPPRGQRTGV
ncbi:hypothetical protein R5R35_002904 [Gryllus longicercus]|uniref:Uncharacterized protein n=1 Tax=Gryllus longicercus TaxID=2509291 RepID=A0AAN9WD83_9ORTH